MDMQESLAALCACSGPSGREGDVRSLAMELLQPLVDEVWADPFGCG